MVDDEVDSDVETVGSVMEDGLSGQRSTTELFSVTLKTTTTYENDQVVNVDRVAQLAYSDNFHPELVNPMELFGRIQEEFREYVNSFERGSRQDI